MVLHNVARILELIVPLMEHPSESFLVQLEEDMMKLILKHGMMVSHNYYNYIFCITTRIGGRHKYFERLSNDQ